MSKPWTHKDLNKLFARGMQVNIQPMPENRVIIPRKESKEKTQLHWDLWGWCKENNLYLLTEFYFHPTRAWRFDFAFFTDIDSKYAIEYNGIFSKKSRHLTAVGHTGDLDKINEAQILGWKVFQYTPLNYKNVLQDIKGIV